jgi:hypothetical protein
LSKENVKMDIEEKINDLEYAIDELGTVINTLKKYTEYSKTVDELEYEKSVLELDLEAEQVKYEELVEEGINDVRELERTYWKEAI